MANFIIPQRPMIDQSENLHFIIIEVLMKSDYDRAPKSSMSKSTGTHNIKVKNTALAVFLSSAAAVFCLFDLFDVWLYTHQCFIYFLDIPNCWNMLYVCSMALINVPLYSVSNDLFFPHRQFSGFNVVI